ncbi:MAG: zf-TFIIB domain-containing protein [Gemmatimonadales bacterium]
MSTTDKPSRNEDEYFLKLEAERIERKRAEHSKLSQDAERKSHHMRCPKCGGHLVTQEFQRIQIDRCPECHGIWLDHGELDALIGHQDQGRLSRVVGDLMGSLKGKNR